MRRDILCKACKYAVVLLVLFLGTLSAQKPANPNADLPQLKTEELVNAMQASTGQKPVVVYVGPAIFYTQAHIRGAEFIGPAAKAEGLDKLRARAASLSHDQSIVVYCGCCPWDHCPNIRPAYDELHKMGFTKVRVLYLPVSFGTDWADKGYPVDKG